MSKELKLGLLAIITIVLGIWGYKFLMGQNVLSKTHDYVVKFSNVDQIAVSTPVTVSGIPVGTVTAIELDPVDLKTAVVHISVDGNLPVTKDTKVEIYSVSLMGERGLRLVIPRPCSGEDCAVDNDELRGRTIGMLDSYLGSGGLDSTFSKLTGNAGSIIDSLNAKLSDPNGDGRVYDIVKNFDEMSKNLAATTANLNELIINLNTHLNNMGGSIDGMLANLEDNNAQITAIMQNAAELTGKLKDAPIDQTFVELNQLLKTTGTTFGEVGGTLEQVESTLANLAAITGDIKDGKGTVGMLLHDQELYENLNDAMEHIQLLLQDLRLHPKRYTTILKKKDVPYVYPLGDPAAPIINDSKPSESN